VQDLIILSLGAHGAETAEIVERVNAVEPTWNLLGFVNPHVPEAEGALNGCPVLGGRPALDDHPDAVFAGGFGCTGFFDLPRERFVNLIDPTCFVSRSARLGAGCVLYPGCFVGFDVRLGDFTFCLSASVINHGCVVEDRVAFAARATLAGTVHVEEDTYLGQACTVRQTFRIGRRSFIGMGAVVIKDVPPESVMVGNPAYRLRDRTPDAARWQA